MMDQADNQGTALRDTYKIGDKVWAKNGANLNSEALDLVKSNSPGQFIKVLAAKMMPKVIANPRTY